jgi:hypothetical protein
LVYGSLLLKREFESTSLQRGVSNEPCGCRGRRTRVGPRVRIRFAPAPSQQRTVRLLSDMAPAGGTRTSGLTSSGPTYSVIALQRRVCELSVPLEMRDRTGYIGPEHFSGTRRSALLNWPTMRARSPSETLESDRRVESSGINRTELRGTWERSIRAQRHKPFKGTRCRLGEVMQSPKHLAAPEPRNIVKRQKKRRWEFSP